MSDDAALEYRFAEAMGRLFETTGLPRMVGRVWATLLITDAPHLTAADLREALGASAGSISTATRSLLQLGLIERIAVRGERRDHFAVRPGAIGDLVRMRLEGIRVVEALMGDAIERFGDRAHARPRLDEIHAVYAWYARELQIGRASCRERG